MEKKSEKTRGERRETDTRCQSMSIGGMYKKYFSIIIQVMSIKVNHIYGSNSI